MAKSRRNKKKNGKKVNRRGVPKTNLAKRIGQTAAAPGPVIEVTDASFNQVVEQSDLPVLVDFWAPWCGPCKAVAPVLEQIAEERKGELRIVKYNTEANSRVAGELQIRSIPTLALFKDGEVADVKVGASSKGALMGWIDKSLNIKKSGILNRVFG